MRLSILDQAPISEGQTPQEALQASMRLAQEGERLGYTRFWIAEHHAIDGLACSAPEIMLSYIGANTKKIRLGSGAVLLPHYKPYKVAEVFHMLATLFPGRIDMGIGRAPGGSAEATEALSDNFLQKVWDMPKSVEELLRFINSDFPVDHKFVNLNVTPTPEVKPEAWLLGTSKKSAILAAEKGMFYAFGLFMSEQDGAEIIQQYKRDFLPIYPENVPKAIITVSVFCAATTEEAEELALSSFIWALKRESIKSGVPSIEDAKKFELNTNEKETLEKMRKNSIIGNPLEVKEKLYSLQEKYQVEEIMIVTITHSPKAKFQSYRYIAEAVWDKKIKEMATL